MSFGFSVGDIILLSQLSYKLYGTLTSGRRNASRELKELEDVLFGLRCALDHLRHVAGDISTAASASASSDPHGREMQQALDQMIQNCATTLEDLDSATKKYRDGAKMPDDEGEADSGSNQKRRKLLRHKIASNWAKILWDIDKDSLKTYRDRLQSHVDSINLVLNTFHWSATEKIHAHNKIQAERLQQFHDKMVESNSFLGLLVQGIHSMLLDSKQTTSATLPTDIEDEFEGLDGFPAGPSSARTKGLASMEKHSIAAYRSPYLLLSTVPTGANTADTAIPSILPVPTARPYISSLAALKATERRPGVKSRITRNELPPKIASINIKRQIQGAKALADFRESSIPKPRPSFLEPAVPTVAQLAEGLEFIFNPLPQNTERQLEIARKARIKEVGLWIQSFDHLINSLATPCAIAGSGNSKLLVTEQHNDLISLLSKMNAAIESSSVNMRDMFYEASSAARVDNVLDKLLSLTNSVRGLKEAEEFTDERTDWMEKH